jgi:RNA methyltransferase, TrmH family
MLNKNKIKYIKQLHQKKYRDLENLYIAEGSKIVEEAIKYYPELLVEFICTQDWALRRDLISHEKACIADYSAICQVSALTTPQETIAILKTNYHSIHDFGKINDIILVLDNIRDPGNLGTIIRLADWFGVENIICSNETVECYNPKVVQATMGAILRAKLYYTDLIDFLGLFAGNRDINIYGATLEGENIYDVTLKTPGFLVMGNESEGISESLKNFINKELLIPNFSKKGQKTESLNVSTATAILLSEIRRNMPIRSGKK